MTERDETATSPSHIRFALAACSPGLVLVAETDAGVCAVLPGEDADALRDDLRRRFPRAELSELPATRVAAEVVASVRDPLSPHDVALDLHGTPFRRLVWDELRRVPAGTTVTYAELARRIGSPSSVRAVAGAVAANPVAVLVPCHRVIRTDGSLSGYRWGVERKRALLEREGALHPETKTGPRR